jgi:ATP-dependent DNA helicase PIF1
VKPFVYCYKCGKYLTKSNADTTFTCSNGHGSWHDSEKWAFCSSAWSAADFIHVNLTTIHRQNDRVFIDILQKCRLGVPFTPQEEDLLLTHDSQTGNAVKLFSTRQEVGAVNREAFNRLRSSQKTYNAYDDFRCYNKNLESKGRRNAEDGTLDALRDHRFDPRIDLKQGMVVVLLVNLDQEAGLVNGSQGVVMGFEKAEDDKMPEAIKKDEKDFSRLGSGPVLTGEHAEIRAANIRTFMDNATEKCWPIVLFQNRITRTILADCRVTELGDEAPYSLISRTQIPLVAGWAMTVHKSQGMTLNRVVVDLRRSFEEGQMYVALSRARGLGGLRVEGLGKQMGCNERVREFLRERLGVTMP